MNISGALLSIIGGLLILVSGLWYLAAPAGAYSVLSWYVTGTAGGALAVIAGLLTLVGGWWVSKGKKGTGAPLALVFSLVAFAVGGGWVLGSVLGIVGALWAWKKPAAA